MSIEDEIEDGMQLNKEGVFKKISGALSRKYSEAEEILSRIEQHEEQIKQLKDKYKTVTEEEMPAMLTELGVSSITLPSGEVVAISTELHCGIPAASKEAAYEWLREHNHGDLIKNEIVVKFGRSEDNMVGAVKKLAEELGLKFDEKSSVHSMTLKAFIKEQMRSGIALPQDLFGVYVRRVVDVKLQKKGI